MNEKSLDASLNEVYLSNENKSTINLFNSILKRDIKSLEASINDGANLLAERPLSEKDSTPIAPISYLFLYGALDDTKDIKDKDLNKKNGFLVRAFNLLVNNKADLITNNTIEVIPEDNHLYEIFLKEAFTQLKNNLDVIKDDKSAYWLRALLKEKNEDILFNFFEKYPLQDNGAPWAFKLDVSDESLLSLSIQTRNVKIIDLFLKDINEQNVDIDPYTFNSHHFTLPEKPFTLLDEVLFSYNNDSDSKNEFYKKVITDLLSKNGKIHQYDYGAKANKLILEFDIEKNKNEVNKGMKI